MKSADMFPIFDFFNKVRDARLNRAMALNPAMDAELSVLTETQIQAIREAAFMLNALCEEHLAVLQSEDGAREPVVMERI